MRRRMLLVALAGLAVLAAGAFVLWPRPDRITLDNYDRMHSGMSRAEAEAILGPPGDYRSGPTEVNSDRLLDYLAFDASGRPTTRGLLVWEGDVATIALFTDQSDYPGSLVYYPMRQTPQSRFDNFVWRVKRQWHRWFP